MYLLPSIIRLYKLGHFFSPEALAVDRVTEDDLRRLSKDDDVVKAAIRSWQGWFKPELDRYAERFHGRQAQVDGDIGPATVNSIGKSRCGMPDYPSPTAATEEANWPEACRRDITTSYRMSLSGLSDERVKSLWLESDWNWEKYFDIHFVFKPEDYPQTRINTSRANLGGSVLADQYLANNSCNFQSRGRVDNRTWNDVLFVTTITHEHGHALGLPHQRDPAATMYPSITQSSMSRRGAPNNTDKAAMRQLGYKQRDTPLDEPTGPNPPPDTPTGPKVWEIDGTKVTHVPSGHVLKLRIIESAGFVG